MDINAEKKFAAGLSITSNALIIATKIVAGMVSGSISIISEAIHSLSDFLASVLTFFAVTRSAEPADKNHPFVWGLMINWKKSMFGGMIRTFHVSLFTSHEKQLLGNKEWLFMVNNY